jgi:hypothetical protein
VLRQRLNDVRPTTIVQDFGLPAEEVGERLAIPAIADYSVCTFQSFNRTFYGAALALQWMAQHLYSASNTPEPPISFGKSFCFGNPSLMLNTFSPYDTCSAGLKSRVGSIAAYTSTSFIGGWSVKRWPPHCLHHLRKLFAVLLYVAILFAPYGVAVNGKFDRTAKAATSVLSHRNSFVNCPSSKSACYYRSRLQTKSTRI